MKLTTTSRFPENSAAWRLLALMTGLVALGAIVSTYRVFNNMYDEPAVIAAGMEWLSRGTYTYEPQHPPLGRIAGAIGPYLAGARHIGRSLMYVEGREILGSGEQYGHLLTLARIGELPFFVALLLVVWLWTRRVSNERTAAVAVFFAAANPNLLAHAGIAGIDIGPAALMPGALLAWVMWLEHPSPKRSLALGVLVAAAGLTKFTAIAYWLPAAIAVAVFVAVTRRRGPRGPRGSAPPPAPMTPRSVLIALGAGAFVTWAVYRFSVGAVGGGITVPAPELFDGLAAFFRRGVRGHPAYLFGHVRDGGWWYYDLVVLLVKTPIPLLIVGGLGCWLAVRSKSADRVALVCGIDAIILVATVTPVDLGVRLLLPLYPLLAIAAALGFAWAWERARTVAARVAVAALLVWSLIEPVTTHPDHIAYFNQMAGPDPALVLVDSNLDWGQDLYRLRDAVRELKMDSLRVHYFGTAEFAAVGLRHARRLRPNERTTGWVAASETFYAGVWADSALQWLHAYTPVGRVGRSIRLYHIAP